MKRKSVPKRCAHCKQDFGQGFALINHMRHYIAVGSAVAQRGFVANQSSSQDKDEHYQSPTQNEDEHHQSSTQDDDFNLQSSTQDQGQEIGPDPGTEQGLQHTQQPIVTEIVVGKLTPKLKAIVEFLETVQFREGQSRAQRQHSLEYTHSCVCAKTMLLPKDIRICWIHVAKVVLLHSLLLPR
jgi:hypothetical protein